MTDSSRSEAPHGGVASNQEVVTYDGLPASAGGAHALRTKNPRVAYENVQAFLDAAVLPVGVPELSFQLWSGGPPDAAERFEAFAASHFGGAQCRQRTHTRWRVLPENVDATLDALNGVDSRAVTAHGHPLASLVWNAQVSLIDPVTSTPYAGIDAASFGEFTVDGYGRHLGSSGVRAAFGTTASSLSLWLAFPAGDQLHRAAAHVQKHLPVRMSTKHWRRWRPTKDGQSYRAVKMASPLV